MKSFIRNILVVAIVAFILQGIWEYSQCGRFYVIDDVTGHTRLMLSATFGDMNMSLILYMLLVVVNNDINWILKKWHRHDYIITILYALFLSFYFEIHALYSGRWGYNPDTMPLFLNTNIGLLPVIQLIILLPLIFYISSIVIKKFIKNKAIY
ncbi:hypothetical protein [Asaccharospora irregularis]|uniref:Uncharacterized protein n=1 Tax=Asaccharospora irregularis DSM 2635 TaxID=1121321 RepID=A0A1M5T8U9_9FIRM|nr:hypothetical protein [Asaccharospora irregularis]SHH47126.1 hypothetical protein SAMN04488530_1543 [Asaccharospora irregularis DSM 2635]